MLTLDLESSIVILKPLEDVWTFMDDPERAREWQPYLVELEQDPPDRMGVGTEQRYVFKYLGQSIRNHYVVTAYEPMTRTAYKSLLGSSIQATGDNIFEELDGGTKLTMSFKPEIGGFFGALPKSFVAWTYRRTLVSKLERIKEILERDGLLLEKMPPVIH